jgi:hypothetical protein
MTCGELRARLALNSVGADTEVRAGSYEEYRIDPERAQLENCCHDSFLRALACSKER